MGSVNSKLLIINSDFVLAKTRNKILATCKAVHICEVEKNLETNKSSIFYQTNQENNVKKDQLSHLDSGEIIWSCIVNEEANNTLREKLENVSLIIVSDKITRDFLENFVGDGVKFIVHS